MVENTLWYGNNLGILRDEIPSETVDLIYLDPPFKSSQNYNVLFAEQDGSRAAAQIKAFEDTWRWDSAAVLAYHQIVELGGRVSEAMQAFHMILGDSDMLAYLAMMAPRLVQMRRVLKPTGSIYLHCDSTASHYLKILMDAVFGPDGFTNEIVWRRYGTHNDVGQGSRHYGRVHDILLFYTRGPKVTWNQVFTPLDPKYIEQTYRYIEPGTGRRFTTTPLTGPGGAAKGNPVFEWKGHMRAWRYNRATMERLDHEGRLYYSRTGYVRQKLYLDESKGVPVQDVWGDIPSLSGAHAERLGYPTQKPVALLERIIKASTNEGDIVLDPFCGCGTAIIADQRLNRQWIGVDITHLAMSLIKNRLTDTFGSAVKFIIKGVPETVAEATFLAKQDQYEFQWWAVGLIGAAPREQERKKGADKGIDGKLYFHDESDPTKTKQLISSVKSGHLKPEYVRDLRGVIEREKAQIGVLLTLQDPTPAMRREAASAGFYHSPGWNTDHPRLQILTAGELLSGKRVDMPPIEQVSTTFRRATRAKTDATQGALALD